MIGEELAENKITPEQVTSFLSLHIKPLQRPVLQAVVSKYHQEIKGSPWLLQQD